MLRAAGTAIIAIAMFMMLARARGACTYNADLDDTYNCSFQVPPLTAIPEGIPIQTVSL
jgi:hypothetical protein